MVAPKKITPKEFHDFIEQGLSHEMTAVEREAVRAAFEPSLRDVDTEEPRPFFGSPQPGLTKKEIEEGMAILRDKNSNFSKTSRARLYDQPAKLDRLEDLLNKAEEGNKEKSWF